MRYIFLFLLFVQICLVSCKSEQKAQTVADFLTLEESESLLIPLDSMTTQETNYIQIINDSLLSFFNKPNYDICIVNLADKTTDKIKIRREGPNAVVGVDGYCYVSPDSIWLYVSWGRKMTLIDSEGQIRSSIQIPRENKDGSMPKYSVLPFPTTSAPYMVKGNRHILQGMNGPESGSQIPGVTIVYDIAKDTLITGNPYPDIYGNDEDLKRWDTFGYRQTSFTITPDGGIVTSFPASDSLYVYYPNDNRRVAHFAGYSSPTNINVGNVTDLNSKYINYLTQFQYCGIVYDNSANVYYRLIRLPKNDYDQNNLANEIARKQNAVIILDSDFNVVGETLLPEDEYYPINMFANSNGLHINVYSDDDDFMKFRVFKLK